MIRIQAKSGPTLAPRAVPSRPGFTLVEMMLVVGIVGLLAAIAVPAITDTSRSFRSKEGSQTILSIVRDARTYAQRRNEPIRMRRLGNQLLLESPTYVGSVTGILRAVDTTAWASLRSYDYRNAGVQITSMPAEVIFCPSEEARFRIDAIDGAAVCALGDMVNANASITFKATNLDYTVDIRAALGNATLKRL